MSFLFPILLALFTSLLGGLYLLGAFRRRRPGEPPLDKGPLPWLGHVLEFRRDTAKFLERMKHKHGDIFTVQLGGFYYTFLTDPHSFGLVVKEARAKLDFNKFARHLIQRVFGYPTTEEEHKLIQASSNKHLMGDGLNLMLQDAELFNYSYNIAFHASYLSLFGNEYSDELFCEFRDTQLGPSDKREAERLKRLFWNILSVQQVKSRENISDWVNESQQERAELGMEDFMLDRHMLLLLWASQGNTGPASFWLLLFLMKHPDAMEAVRGEVEEVLRETGQEVKRGGPLINLTRDMLQSTPILDSVVDESLRMTAAPLLTRAVLDDMTLNMANRQQYIRMGDRVSLFPYTTVQTDPETQKVNITACPGVSMCTGSIILLMLTYFDLKNPDEEIPDIDLQRLGIGVMHSTKDIQFRYRVILDTGKSAGTFL
uniref:Cytochrome P450, family 8, subfamily B, polypeptide 2 n=1 Tax=Electrophorus electricus TaxID=8005 RepID=A0AAY5EMM2_ELEEL